MELVIKKVRKERGLSLRRLEELTGISKTQLHNIERKTRDVELEELAQIALHLDVCTKDLFFNCYGLKKKCNNNCQDCCKRKKCIKK